MSLRLCYVWLITWQIQIIGFSWLTLIFVFKCVISVCDYFVHEACQEFAVPNCVESATYDPAKSLNDPKNCTGTTHHFQEGNLPNNSKCVKCRRSCWSVECLTGMRCQWCGITVHTLLYSHKILKITILLNSDISFYLNKSFIVFYSFIHPAYQVCRRINLCANLVP